MDQRGRPPVKKNRDYMRCMAAARPKGKKLLREGLRRQNDMLKKASRGNLSVCGRTTGSNALRVVHRSNQRQQRRGALAQHLKGAGKARLKGDGKARSTQVCAVKTGVSQDHKGHAKQPATASGTSLPEEVDVEVDLVLERLSLEDLSVAQMAGQCAETVVRRTSKAGWGLFAAEHDIGSGDLVAILSWGPVMLERSGGTQKVRGGYQRYSTDPSGNSAWRGGCANEASDGQTRNAIILEVPPHGRRRSVFTVLVAVCNIPAGCEVLVDYGRMLEGEACWPHRAESGGFARV